MPNAHSETSHVRLPLGDGRRHGATRFTLGDQDSNYSVNPRPLL